MKVFEIIGWHEDTEDQEESFGIWQTRERAEQRMQNEYAAYTFNGKCEWSFRVEEREVAK